MAEIHELKMQASRDRIVEALTDSTALARWQGAKVTGTKREWRLQYPDGTVFRWQVVEASPERVVWRCVEGPGQAVGKEASFTFTDAGNGRTLVEFAHSGWQGTTGNYRKCNTRCCHETPVARQHTLRSGLFAGPKIGRLRINEGGLTARLRASCQQQVRPRGTARAAEYPYWHWDGPVANEEHVAMLKKGVRAPGMHGVARTPDLAEATLSVDESQRGELQWGEGVEMTNGLIKPSERFQQEIQPALDDYLKNPLSERLAKNLARAVDHQVDWTFEYYKQNDPSRLNGASDVKSFRRQLVTQCSELQIMNDLSDAAHHRFLTRPNNPPRVVVQSSAAFSLRSPTGGGSVQLYISAYGPFLPAATKAVAFWRNWQD
jgi:uncharacterized protein YndB with AHSA1/START domain